MKKCLFCAEEIQSEAIKCRYCGEQLDTKPTIGGSKESPPVSSPQQSKVATPPIEKSKNISRIPLSIFFGGLGAAIGRNIALIIGFSTPNDAFIKVFIFAGIGLAIGSYIASLIIKSINSKKITRGKKVLLAWGAVPVGLVVYVVLFGSTARIQGGANNPLTKENVVTETPASAWAPYDFFGTEAERVSADADNSGGGAELRAPAPTSAPVRDDRFFLYKNGTVWDIKTNLMWAATDNGSGIKWADAMSYCKNYRGGRYTDWRMPTLNELEVLHGSGIYNNYIKLTGTWVWTSQTSGRLAASFNFLPADKNGNWVVQDYDYTYRALPVRSVK